MNVTVKLPNNTPDDEKYDQNRHKLVAKYLCATQLNNTSVYRIWCGNIKNTFTRCESQTSWAMNFSTHQNDGRSFFPIRWCDGSCVLGLERVFLKNIHFQTGIYAIIGHEMYCAVVTRVNLISNESWILRSN